MQRQVLGIHVAVSYLQVSVFEVPYPESILTVVISHKLLYSSGRTEREREKGGGERGVWSMYGP